MKVVTRFHLAEPIFKETIPTFHLPRWSIGYTLAWHSNNLGSSQGDAYSASDDLFNGGPMSLCPIPSDTYKNLGRQQ